MVALVGLLALLIGATVGLLGGGGATLTLPLLLYGLGMPAHDAAAGSLAVVCATTVVGALVHARTGNVELRTALAFGSASTLAAYLGGRAAGAVPASALVGLFTVAMLASAWRMLTAAPGATGARPRPRWMLVAVASLVGGFAGLVGAGGGFLVVPALMLVGGLAMHRAVATSLVVIAVQSAAGLAGQLSHASIDPGAIAVLAGLSALGAAIGAAAAPRLPACALRRGFAVLLVAVATLFLVRELPAGWLADSAGTAVAAAGFGLWWRTRPRLAA
jgi:uncharacterized membrane protein YfcA